MAAHREVALSQPFNFVPTTLKEAQEYATIFANSGLCPEAYKGRPNDILIVWQMGKEIGLDKMQALRTLGCINGMPFAYGDGQLALVKRHPEFVDMHEWFEGELEKGTLTAYCTMTRKNQEPITQKFSIDDAKRAGLWGKKGTWTQYPRRMLQHRARGFAAKDTFPDALYGLMSEDEAQGVAQAATIVEAPKPKGKGMSALEETLGIKEDESVIEGEVICETVEPQAMSKLDELNELITRLNVTQAAITVTLKKFGVEAMENLTDEMIDKWSNHLKTKERK